MIHILFVGYGKDQTYYENIKSEFWHGTSFSWLDNASAKGNICGKPFMCPSSNRLYEFSGYFDILENFMALQPNTSGSVIWLLNDTSIDHHAFFLWKKIVKYSTFRDLKDVVLADVRAGENLDGIYQYAASWMYVFKSDDAFMFSECLKLVLNYGSANIRYYEVEAIERFGLHLDRVKRERLLTWLFSQKKYRGWQYASEFKSVPFSVRVRKGICIEMESLLTTELKTAGISFVDLKSHSVGFFVSVLDRLITLIIKVRK